MYIIKTMKNRGDKMLKFIGWIAIIYVGLVTGIIQAVLAMIGVAFIFVGTFLSAIPAL